MFSYTSVVWTFLMDVWRITFRHSRGKWSHWPFVSSAEKYGAELSTPCLAILFTTRLAREWFRCGFIISQLFEFYERVSGARMHAAYVRPGGVDRVRFSFFLQCGSTFRTFILHCWFAQFAGSSARIDGRHPQMVSDFPTGVARSGWPSDGEQDLEAEDEGHWTHFGRGCS